MLIPNRLREIFGCWSTKNLMKRVHSLWDCGQWGVHFTLIRSLDSDTSCAQSAQSVANVVSIVGPWINGNVVTSFWDTSSSIHPYTALSIAGGWMCFQCPGMRGEDIVPGDSEPCGELWWLHPPLTCLPCRQIDRGQRWVGGRQSLICLSTSLSRHFMMMGVTATGLWSFRLSAAGFLGTRIIVAVLRQGGTMECARDRSKMCVKTAASW